MLAAGVQKNRFFGGSEGPPVGPRRQKQLCLHCVGKFVCTRIF